MQTITARTYNLYKEQSIPVLRPKEIKIYLANPKGGIALHILYF